MAHAMSCKSLHSCRSCRKVHIQPLAKSCRKLPVCCTDKQHHGETQKPVLSNKSTRRALLQAGPALLGLQMFLPEEPAEAVGFKKDMQRRRGFKAQIPEEDFQAGPKGLKYFEMTPGKGALPKKGDRIAVHYEIRWHGVTFMTSRQGMGVTGGEPLGFNLGAQGPGGTLPGLDLTVQAGEGMRVGGSRKAILPPELALPILVLYQSDQHQQHVNIRQGSGEEDAGTSIQQLSRQRQGVSSQGVSDEDTNGHAWHGRQVVAAALAEGGSDSLLVLIQRFRQSFTDALHPKFLPSAWHIMHSADRDFGEHSIYASSSTMSRES